MSSAAALGVGARTSATKSAMVKSTSWPTPEIVGTGDRAMVRATRFVVEAPQILDRAAAARDDDRVEVITLIQSLQRGDDLGRSIIALHGRRREHHPQQRPAAANDVEHVLQGRAGGRGDNADGVHDRRERAFPIGFKEALGLQLRLEPLELLIEIAHARRLDRVDVELIRALHFVHADLAVRKDGVAFARGAARWAVTELRHMAHLMAAPLSLSVK